MKMTRGGEVPVRNNSNEPPGTGEGMFNSSAASEMKIDEAGAGNGGRRLSMMTR
ncbi:hypothetical protein LCGC14_2728770, partial [marine sediment metagenome]